MTNDPKSSVGVACEEWVERHARKTAGIDWSGNDVRLAFIAGADWQREQLLSTPSVRLVPRIGPGVVIGVDHAGPHSDYTAVSVWMTRDEYDKREVRLERFSRAAAHGREQIAKLESQNASQAATIRSLQDHVQRDGEKIDNMQERIQARDEKIKAQEAVIASKTERYMDILKENAGLQGMIDKLTADSDNWKSSATGYAEDVHRLKHELGIVLKRVRDVGNAHSIQMDPGNCHADEYMRGMANGLEFAMATLEGREVAYVLHQDESMAEVRKAADDMASFGTGCTHMDETGKVTAIDPRCVFVRGKKHDVREFVPEDDCEAEPTGGFTAMGEAGGPEKPIDPDAGRERTDFQSKLTDVINYFGRRGLKINIHS